MIPNIVTLTVRPEPVEGLSFFCDMTKEGVGFDKLSPNGVGVSWRS